jgi:hypothetical protein
VNRCCRFVAAGGLVALVCLFATGCGSKSATVTGRVTYNGKPVSNGSVIVYCSDKQIVRGNIAADGAYSIPNVPYGTSVVTVQSHARVPPGLRLQQSPPPSSGGPIPPTVEYTDTARVTIPQRYGLPEESGLGVVVDHGAVTFDIVLADRKP